MKRRAWVAAMVGVVLLAGCAHHGKDESARAAARPRVRVMTYNVNWGGPRMNDTIAVIRESGADVVCLQEITPAWEKRLRAELGTEYPHMLFRMHLFPAGGMAVLSRWEVAEAKYVQPLGGWFPAWILMARTPIGEIQVAAVHLHPNVPSREGHRHVKKVRREEIESLMKHVEGGRATVVLGDFNEGYDELAVRYLVERGFRNAVYRSGEVEPGWPVDVAGEHFPDHILFSPELECLGAAVIERGGSDHPAVVASVGAKRRSGETGTRTIPFGPAVAT